MSQVSKDKVGYRCCFVNNVQIFVCQPFFTKDHPGSTRILSCYTTVGFGFFVLSKGESVS